MKASSDNKIFFYSLISLTCHLGAIVFVAAMLSPVLVFKQKSITKKYITASFGSREAPSTALESLEKTIDEKHADAKNKDPKKSQIQKELKRKDLLSSSTKLPGVSNSLAVQAENCLSPSLPNEAGSDATFLSQGFPSVKLVVRERPLLINGEKVTIPYPKKAKYMKVEGIVRLRLTVSEKGEVIDAKILSGPAFGLEAAAVALARKFAFLPATDDMGEAKTTQIDHEVVFRLSKQAEAVEL